MGGITAVHSRLIGLIKGRARMDPLEIGADIKRMKANNENRVRLTTLLENQNNQLVHLRSCLEKGFGGVNIQFSSGNGTWTFGGQNLRSNHPYTRNVVKLHELLIEMAVMSMEHTYAQLEKLKDEQ